MIWHLLLLVGGFLPLILGARWFVEGAAALARTLRVPPMAIGLTLVAFGTSMPELVVNLEAALQQRGELVLGNVAGSNLFNLLLILGVTALVRPLPVNRRTTWVEIPLSLTAAVALLAAAGDRFLGGMPAEIGRGDAIFLLLFFGVFIGYTVSLLRSEESPPAAVISPPTDALPFTVPSLSEADQKGAGSHLVRAGAGALVLIAGARAVVYGAGQTALLLGVGERLVALTIVAAGTSLPELVTSVTAARRGETDLAVGNVVGSNIFNIFFVLGISAAVFPVPVSAGAAADIIFLTAVSLLLFLFLFIGRGRTVERWEGALFLLLFVGYSALSWLGLLSG